MKEAIIIIIVILIAIGIFKGNDVFQAHKKEIKLAQINAELFASCVQTDLLIAPHWTTKQAEENCSWVYK